MELDPHICPEEIMSRKVELGWAKLDVFCFELSKLFVNSGATDIVLVTLSSTAVEAAIAQCTSRWAMARGHRLNTSIVLAAVHGLSGLFRAVSAVEPFTPSPPSHSVPVPNRPTRLCGRKATLNQTKLVLLLCTVRTITRIKSEQIKDSFFSLCVWT